MEQLTALPQPLRRLKGRFILTINGRSEHRDPFAAYALQTVTAAANMRPGQPFNELIIHNLQSPCA